MKISFEVTAVVDPDDGLQPSDLTPETANIRVMILKSNHVSVRLNSDCIELFNEWISSFTGKANFSSLNCNANTGNIPTGHLLEFYFVLKFMNQINLCILIITIFDFRYQ